MGGGHPGELVAGAVEPERLIISRDARPELPPFAELVTIGLALLAAGARIRDRRLLRYASIAAALGLGTAYALWNAQGIAEVDAVERVHFVEYGLITFLFYRVWRPRDDASMLVLPLVAGLAVGTLEEWLQWFIPGRVGDMRDVDFLVTDTADARLAEAARIAGTVVVETDRGKMSQLA